MFIVLAMDERRLGSIMVGSTPNALALACKLINVIVKWLNIH